MVSLSARQDVSHFWGSDINVSQTGDMARVEGVERSKQRVLRRLMTNPGEYSFHPEYGGGIPARIGTILNLAEVGAAIRKQMELEDSVSQADPISVDVQQITNGVAVSLAYVALPDKQPVTLSFDVSV